LLRHNQFATPEIGQITQIRIIKFQKYQNYLTFYKNTRKN